MSGSTAGAARPDVEASMTSTVLDFRPTRHGFHFANRFPSGPTVTFGPFDTRWLGVGDAAAGLCGGMALTVRDLFEARVDPPLDTQPPDNGTPRFKALVRRQVQSLDWLRVPLRFYDLAAFRPLAIRRPVPDVTLGDEWPKVRAEIDAGHLAVLGLIRNASANPFKLTANHQVVAYGYRAEPQSVVLRLYDPNWPDRDDVEARLFLDAGRAVRLESSTGEPLLGFFLAPYQYADPRAWRS
jgi:hypothetical protein